MMKTTQTKTERNVCMAKASNEFSLLWSSYDIALWMKKWHKSVGHKRLAYILMTAAGIQPNFNIKEQ